MLVASFEFSSRFSRTTAHCRPHLLVLKKHRFDQVEIAFLLHALHQDAADHAAPTNETYVHD